MDREMKGGSGEFEAGTLQKYNRERQECLVDGYGSLEKYIDLINNELASNLEGDRSRE